MTEIVSLRRARKRRAREAASQEAAGNRVRFGTPKELRARKTALDAQEARRLEGHRRMDSEADDART
jgi:Domain of unknown function (DUF4169)